MIDPQGQAVSWIRSKESSNLPAFGTAALNDPKLRDKLEFTMGDGKALIILGKHICVAHRVVCFIEQAVVLYIECFVFLYQCQWQLGRRLASRPTMNRCSQCP